MTMTIAAAASITKIVIGIMLKIGIVLSVVTNEQNHNVAVWRDPVVEDVISFHPPSNAFQRRTSQQTKITSDHRVLFQKQGHVGNIPDELARRVAAMRIQLSLLLANELGGGQRVSDQREPALRNSRSAESS